MGKRLNEMEQPKEQVLLLAAETNQARSNWWDSLLELEHLVTSAGGEVRKVMTQKRPSMDHKTILGKGKIEEAIAYVEAEAIDLVILNHELTPRQQQNLAGLFGVRVIDRVQLILDIFALRARSKEGRLQVELAQLNYLYPRLAGQGQALSRLGGGIGTRGPGETKLETDRRHIRTKIYQVKAALKEVAAHRERNRAKRQDSRTMRIGLLGYTNAGKSTLLNLLTQAKTYAQDQLFATLDPLTKQWVLPSGMQVTLTDTVGFIQDLPTQLIEAFHSTLEESQHMDLLLHVVDASSPNRDAEEQTVLELLAELKMEQIPRITVYNKADQIELAHFVPTLQPAVIVSAKQVATKKMLEQQIEALLQLKGEAYEVAIPALESGKLHQWVRETFVQTQEYDEQQEVYRLKGFYPLKKPELT